MVLWSSDELLGRELEKIATEQGQEIAITRERDERLEAEIERLRAALKECAADYISQPCTIAGGYMYLSVEFERRMGIAAQALEQKEDRK